MISMSLGAAARRLVAAAVAALLALLALAAATPVAAHSPDPILGGGLYGQDQVLRYRWAGAPPSAMQAAIGRGVTDASSSRGSRAPTFSYSSTGTSTVYYGVDVPCGVNALACARRYVPTSFGVWFRENGHRYDWGTLQWCELTGSPTGCFEAESVTVHELGHVMILDHHVNLPDGSDALDSVMQTVQPARAKAGWNAHAYARCDVATLQQQYDVPTAASLYSTCLDVPTSLGLVAGQTAVSAGTPVTFTATLRTAGTGRLSDNLVAGRTVVLQRLTSSGWVDIATMAPGSSPGTYATAVAVWSAGDYRALFRKPAAEGLRASSSPSISMTVIACPLSRCPQPARAAG